MTDTPLSAPPTTTSPEPTPIIAEDKKPDPSPLDSQPVVETSKEAPKTDDKKSEEVKYDFKAPEGFDTKELEAFAKAEKLAPAVAQKILDREMQLTKDLVAFQASERAEEIKKGLSEIYADPVLGGKNIDATKATVANVWGSLPTELRKEITDLGYHNDKRLIRLLHHVGQGMKEGKFVQPSADAPPKASPQSALESMFAAIHKT